MKLVVCFSTGDGYTYSCDHVMPVEYDSAEQLLVDIEAEVMRAVRAQQDLLDCYSEYDQAEKTFRNKRGVTVEQISEWRFNNRVPKFDTEVNLFGQHWNFTHFYSSELKKVYEIDICTLDEWFTQNLVAVK